MGRVSRRRWARRNIDGFLIRGSDDLDQAGCGLAALRPFARSMFGKGLFNDYLQHLFGQCFMERFEDDLVQIL